MTRPRIGPGVKVEVFGDKHVIGVMEAWAMRAGRAEPAYQAIHEYLLDVEAELFATEGASGEHGFWEPVRAGEDQERPILQETKALMYSLTDENDPHHQFLITPWGFSMGTDLPYAEVHQRGNDLMPARRVFDLTYLNRQKILEMIHLWITRGGFVVGGLPSALGFRTRGAGGRFVT